MVLSPEEFFDQNREKTLDHLAKFQHGWIERLVTKWLDHYYNIRPEDEQGMSKDEFREFMLSNIRAYCGFFFSSKEFKSDFENISRLGAVRDRFRSLIVEDKSMPVPQRWEPLIDELKRTNSIVVDGIISDNPEN